MSSDIHTEIRFAVDAMCRASAERVAPGGPSADLDHELWGELAEAGFSLLGVPEGAGGSGGDLDDLAVAVDTVARHAAPVPLAETAFLSGWLLAGAGMQIPAASPLTASSDALTTDPSGTTVSGEVEVPWGRHCGHAIIPVKRDGELLVAAFPLEADGNPRIAHGANLAGEPRDVLSFDRCPLPEQTARAAAGIDLASVARRAALARSVQMAGAAEAALEMSLRYAKEREQFGRPLNRFQAIQQSLAVLAGQVSMMRSAAAAAVQAVQDDAPGAAIAVAAAKATTSASATTVAALAHQIHGALGFTQEHRLGAATTRLWSWREEYGGEGVWQDALADLVLASEGWWPALTR